MTQFGPQLLFIFLLPLLFHLLLAESEPADQQQLQAQPADTNAAEKAAENAAKSFIPLLRNGQVVNAKLNQPTGPSKASVEFGQQQKEAKPVRAVFSGKDGAGKFFRKRLSATFGSGGKGQETKTNLALGGGGDGAVQGAQQQLKQEKEKQETNQEKEAAVAILPRSSKRRAELSEKLPTLEASEQSGKQQLNEDSVEKAKEGKKDGQNADNGTNVENAKKVEEEVAKNGKEKAIEKQKPISQGGDKLKANIRDGDSDGTGIRDGDSDGTRQKDGPEAEEEEPELGKDEEWNTWSFLPSLFGGGGASPGQGQGSGELKKPVEEAKAPEGRLQANPAGGHVELAVPSQASTSEAECEDLAENCVENKAFCVVSPYEQLMADNCQLTCGKCSAHGKQAEAGKVPEEVGKLEGQEKKEEEGEQFKKKEAGGKEGKQCSDLSARCPQWAQRGFCTSRFFHRELKLRFCAKSCSLCAELAKAQAAGTK